MKTLVTLGIVVLLLGGCASNTPKNDLSADLEQISSTITQTKAGDFGDFMVALHKADDDLDKAEEIYHNLSRGDAEGDIVEYVQKGKVAAKSALNHRNHAEDALDNFFAPMQESIEDNSQSINNQTARLAYLEALHIPKDTKIPQEKVYFNFASHRISIKEKEKITQIISFLRQYPVFALKITGYADTVGSKKRNVRLAERRNKAVLSELRRQGLPQNTVVTVAIGEPLDGPDETRNPENRKVIIKLYVHGS